MNAMSVNFDFGENWKHFSESRLDPARLDAAMASLERLIGAKRLRGRRVLDIGCGSGLFSIAAARLGAASVLGFDINVKSARVSQQNIARLGARDVADRLSFAEGSVLDADFVGGLGTFDVVYAWGSLHHTGDMRTAIRHAASRVDPRRGVFVLAIYNRHWTSPVWSVIKRVHNLSPRPVRLLMKYGLGSATALKMWVGTGRSPFRKRRGMDFWVDVVDWLGGYPYEYASVREIAAMVKPLGFDLRRVVRTEGWTGCNEFVFSRRRVTS